MSYLDAPADRTEVEEITAEPYLMIAFKKLVAELAKQLTDQDTDRPNALSCR
ncbi:hypothetical protein [Actinomadura sp. 7K507]|uniref:hypothetical protein n=1 Tax=Actinomadura sp. 7K507 TaxID=2530365 RepID=UPI00140451AC|nr:hypothetical protein [Actinomadura sp. 7K507]